MMNFALVIHVLDTRYSLYTEFRKKSYILSYSSEIDHFERTCPMIQLMLLLILCIQK